MDWTAALRARLIADTAVANLLASTAAGAKAVFWVDRPQESTLPAITLQLVAETRPQTFLGFDGLDRSMVQIDCWGLVFGTVQQLKEAVIAALIVKNSANGIKFERAFIDAIRDLGERTDTQFIHRASIDMIFHHSTA